MEITKVQIEEELRTLLLKIIDVDPEELKPQAHFFKDLNVDSIKAIEIAVAIEKHFKVSIKEDEIEQVTTLQKAANIIYSNLTKI